MRKKRQLKQKRGQKLKQPKRTKMVMAMMRIFSWLLKMKMKKENKNKKKIIVNRLTKKN